MMILTKEIKRALIKNNGVKNKSLNKPVFKLFTPWGACTWLISEIYSDNNEMFGLADLGMGCPELGYVSLNELMNIQGPFGLKVERDLWFTPKMTLIEYAEKARQEGGIYNT